MKRDARSDAAPALYRIQTVAKTTGVSEHSLRVWERRYGAMASHRSDAGYRLYSDADVARIRLLKELIDEGHAIGEIAALRFDQLARLRRGAGPELREAPLPEPVAATARQRFLEAIERLDSDEASRVIAAAVVAFGPFELATQIAAPILTEIGQRWSTGRFSVAQEHAASAVLRGHLAEILRAARPHPRAPTLVVSTPEGELHELGAMLAAVVAADAGARVLYLGPSLPASDLAQAVEASAAGVAALSILAMSPRATRAALDDLRRALPKSVAIWVGGSAVTAKPRAGVTWVRTLADLRATIASRASSAP